MNTTNREKRNWLIHSLYIRQDFKACMEVCSSAFRCTHFLARSEVSARGEYWETEKVRGGGGGVIEGPAVAPRSRGWRCRAHVWCGSPLQVVETQLQECNNNCEYAMYVKALIKRQRGQIAESLQLFQAATCINPHNVANLKQALARPCNPSTEQSFTLPCKLPLPPFLK